MNVTSKSSQDLSSSPFNPSDVFSHRNVFFSVNKSWSQVSGAYVLLSECRWAGTHFGQPCWSVHVSGRVCPGFGASQLRPSDLDSGNLAFMSGASSNLRVSSQPVLTHLGGARFIVWCLRHLF